MVYGYKAGYVAAFWCHPLPEQFVVAVSGPKTDVAHARRDEIVENFGPVPD